MKRGTIVTLVVLALFAALLLYNTLSAQKVECNVCVEYKGGKNCAEASHESREEAIKSAQTTACGTLASGMNESIACSRVKPATVQCKTK